MTADHIDELEDRIGAIEVAVIALFSWAPRQDIDDAIADISAGLEQAGDDRERCQRRGAIGLLEAARDRWQGPQIGIAIERQE